MAGLSRFDLSLWDELLAQNVVLHKDSVTLFDDLHGAPAYEALMPGEHGRLIQNSSQLSCTRSLVSPAVGRPDAGAKTVKGYFQVSKSSRPSLWVVDVLERGQAAPKVEQPSCSLRQLHLVEMNSTVALHKPITVLKH